MRLPHRQVGRARLYLSGIGLQLATVNGRQLTNEVLAPGNSNYQLSSEYRAYDVADELRKGGNTLGVRLGNGPAYGRPSTASRSPSPALCGTGRNLALSA